MAIIITVTTTEKIASVGKDMDKLDSSYTAERMQNGAIIV